MNLSTLILAVSAFQGTGSRQVVDPRPADVFAMRGESQVGESAKVSAERRQRYVSVMAALARHPAPLDSDLSVEAEIVRAARDHAAHPELVVELRNLYVVKVNNPRSRLGGVNPSPPPQEPHVAAPYRYAWEYVLLMPSDQDSAPGYGGTALEALAKIHKDDSLPLFVAYFRNLDPVYARDSSVASQAQEAILPMMADFVSERGLDAILECASDMQTMQANAGIPAEFRTNVGRLVAALIEPRFNPRRAEAWAEVRTSYERRPERRTQTTILRGLLKKSNTRP